MATNFWPKIKHTAEDVSTLEINTILKSDMVCVKISDNDMLALYELAKTYNSKLIDLGNEYLKAFQDAGETTGDVEVDEDHNFFRGRPIYQLAGPLSFKELSKAARHAAKKMKDIRYHLDFPKDKLRIDEMILTRIEMQSYEISNILEDYSIEEKTEKDLKTTIGNFIKQPNVKLSFRHRLVMQKALDLGVERVVMQTRVGMDGDITTRVSERFAANPQQFVLDLHNKAVDLSVGFWKTLFDTLVSFGQKILAKEK